MRVKGILTQWDDKKGFGFITEAKGGRSIFIHINDFVNHQKRPQLQSTITFQRCFDQQGRTKAINATHQGERLIPAQSKAKGHKRKSTSTALMIPVLFVIVLLGLMQSKAIHWQGVMLYAFMSIFTFIAYALDKKKAQVNQWRTPESTLQILALLGGWPGAMMAQKILRHKSKKITFRVTLILMVILNIGGLAYFISASR